MRASSSRAKDNVSLYHSLLAISGLLCLASVIRSYLLLIDNSLHVTPAPIFSIYSADFLCFYAAAQVGVQSLVEIYEPSKLYAAQAAVISAAGASHPYYLYAYPPFVAVFFRPLASLSFINAYFAWLCVSYAAVVLVTHRLLPCEWSSLQRWGMSILIPAVFPFFSFHALMAGQTTALGIVILGLAVALKRDKPVLAGIVFSLGLYKPPLFAVFALLALLRRDWRFLGGACIGALAILASSVATHGIEPWVAFGNSASGYVYGGRLSDGRTLLPGKGMGLVSALICLTSSVGIGWCLFGVTALAMLLTHYKLMRRGSSDDALHTLCETCSAIILSYLLSVQSPNYDAGLLLIPVTLLIAALNDRLRDNLLVVTSLGFIMVAGTLSTENGSSVSTGFLAVAFLWGVVTFLWARQGTSGKSQTDNS